jgi:hypothetical protein
MTKNRIDSAFSRHLPNAPAQLSWHGAVDSMHMLENREDVNCALGLTEKIGGVKRKSFFGSLKRFAGWWRVRDSNRITLQVLET